MTTNHDIWYKGDLLLLYRHMYLHVAIFCGKCRWTLNIPCYHTLSVWVHDDTSPSKPIQPRTKNGSWDAKETHVFHQSLPSVPTSTNQRCTAFNNFYQPNLLRYNGLTHGSSISNMACIRESKWLSIGQNHIAQVCEHVFPECTW